MTIRLVWYFFTSSNHHLHIMIICIRLRKVGIYSEIDSSCEGFLSIDKDAFQSSSASISSRAIRIISFIQFIISAQTEQMIISVINLDHHCGFVELRVLSSRRDRRLCLIKSWSRSFYLVKFAFFHFVLIFWKMLRLLLLNLWVNDLIFS